MEEPNNQPADEEDPFRKLPELVVKEHLIKFLREPTDLASLMGASPWVCEVMKSFSGTETWMNTELMNSVPYKEYFRSESSDIRKLFENSPGWGTVAGNYFELVFSLERNYSNCRFLEEGSTSPFFNNAMHRLWIFNSSRVNPVMVTSPDVINEVLKQASIDNRAGHLVLDRYFCFPIRCFHEGVMRNIWELFDRQGSEMRAVEFRGPELPKDNFRLNMSICLEKAAGLTQLKISNFTPVSISELGKYFPPGMALPPLPNLRVLELELNLESYEPFSIYLEQVTTLDVDHPNFLKWYDPLKHSVFPNLKRLSVRAASEEDLLKLEGLKSPLKEIKLQYPSGTSLLTCLSALETFGRTLSAARISTVRLPSAVDVVNQDLDPEREIQLPKLRVLEIYNHGDFSSLDALLHLGSSLAYLEILGGRRLKPGICGHVDGPILKLWEHWEDDWENGIYNSNVWSLIPALVELKFQSQLYKRSELEALKKRQSNKVS